jgi:hypothetical protein
LDARVFGKIHYYKDSSNNGYYDDRCGTWLYDHVIVLHEPMYRNILREKAELKEGTDQDMEDIGYEDEESDLEYEPPAHGGSLDGVMHGMRNMELFMSQRFDAQDVQFKELKKRFDAHNVQFRYMRAYIQRWENATTVGLSPSQYFSSPYSNPN